MEPPRPEIDVKHLGHIYKMRFLFFWAISYDFNFKMQKNANERLKKFLSKFDMGYHKTQKLMLNSNPLK
jgi:hypothetical protein